MPAPAIRIPVSADVDKFQRDMDKTRAVAGAATRAIAVKVIEMNASFLASQGAAGAATLALGRVLGILGPIALGVIAVRDAFRLMAYATELAKARIEEFNDVAAKANASGFSTEFFQRITKSGGEARDKIDDLAAALKRFNDASTPQLGGSDLQKRLDQLTKAGNFRGNTGVASLASASDSEGRLRAVAALIDQAMQKGERLAALDLAGTVFGPKVAAALRADSGYLDDMVKRADALSRSQLVSDEDLGRALDLKRRMEAAQQVLADRWKPIQNDLAQLGMNYHASWVSITEDLAAAVGYATQLYQALKQVPDWFANRIGGASIWKSLTDASGALGLNSDPASMGVVMRDDPRFGETAANQKLAAALKNYHNVTRSMQQAQDIATAVRGDRSKNPSDDKDAEANAFDRAAESIERHTARTEADTKAVGLGAAALAEFRAESQLLLAAQQAGIPVTQQLKDKIQDLAQDASDAAEALARARVASDISFGRQTAFLSAEDVAIARQLSTIYGNDVSASLGSSEAAAIRLNNALSDINRTGQDTTRGFLVDFNQQVRNSVSGLDALKTAGANALGRIGDKLAQMASDNLWSSAFGGSGGLGGFFAKLLGGGGAATVSFAGASALYDDGGYTGPGDKRKPAGIVHKGEVVWSQEDVARNGGVAVVDAMRRGRRGYDDGGLVGATLPAMPAIRAASALISAPIAISIDARGADREGLARAELKLDRLRADLPALIVTHVRQAQKDRKL